MTRSPVKALRKIGNTLSLKGTFSLPQTLLRRSFRYARGTYNVNDFDGDLSVELRLSEHMERRIFWMGYYNKEIVALLNTLLREGMVVVDVGANIGEISMVCAKRVGPKGRVIAFEPIDEIADELQRNIERNNLHQVVLARTGLSDAILEQVPIFASCGQRGHGDEHRGLGSLYGQAAEGAPLQTINVTTMDAYLAANPVARVDIIKVDIEGAELPFLRGAEWTLKNFKPLLIVEVQEKSAAAAGYRAVDILEFLSDLGYTFARIGRHGRLSPLRSAGLAEYQNVLCTPG
jgi:FkbM family methyltransferase